MGTLPDRLVRIELGVPVRVVAIPRSPGRCAPARLAGRVCVFRDPLRCSRHRPSAGLRGRHSRRARDLHADLARQGGDGPHRAPAHPLGCWSGRRDGLAQRRSVRPGAGFPRSSSEDRKPSGPARGRRSRSRAADRCRCPASSRRGHRNRTGRSALERRPRPARPSPARGCPAVGGRRARRRCIPALPARCLGIPEYSHEAPHGRRRGSGSSIGRSAGGTPPPARGGRAAKCDQAQLARCTPHGCPTVSRGQRARCAPKITTAAERGIPRYIGTKGEQRA